MLKKRNALSILHIEGEGETKWLHASGMEWIDPLLALIPHEGMIDLGDKSLTCT